MKVAIITRSTLYDSPGGDTVQIEMTKYYLEELGVKVDVYLSSSKINYNGYDILHFFNIIRPGDILKHIKPKCKIVISTIYVDYEEYELRETKGLRNSLVRFLGSDNLEFIKSIARSLLGKERIQSLSYFLRGHKNSIRYLIRRADCLLPNSQSELKRVFDKYGVETEKYKIVPNGIDLIKYSSVIADNKYKDSIICVGRIEGRKNQYRLIKAVNELPYQCYIIGKPSINDLAYYKRCKSIAKGHIKFIDHIPQDKLFGIMKAAKVHVLPSWFETTGLVSLEAAYLDCNIVVTRKGDQEEYFKNDVFYCKPDSIDSIKSAISNAYRSELKLSLKDRILHNYTWKLAAEKTLEAYQEVLGE